jgi:transposase
MGLLAELHNFMRFTSPRGLMALLGLVPSKHSSGSSRRQGSITLSLNCPFSQ